jgi:hypothetical protein
MRLRNVFNTLRVSDLIEKDGRIYLDSNSLAPLDVKCEILEFDNDGDCCTKYSEWVPYGSRVGSTIISLPQSPSHLIFPMSFVKAISTHHHFPK